MTRPERTHECPAKGCTARLPRHKLMCLRHWRLVPLELQAEVGSAWRAFQRWGAAVDGVVERYLHVRQAAVDAADAASPPEAAP